MALSTLDSAYLGNTKYSTSKNAKAPSHGSHSHLIQGTSGKNLSRAISTYLNQTGPGDYNLPRMFGEPSIETQKRTNPAFSIRSRVRLPWSPEHKVDFLGSSSPAATKYSPF